VELDIDFMVVVRAITSNGDGSLRGSSSGKDTSANWFGLGGYGKTLVSSSKSMCKCFSKYWMWHA
jgi:hypothetical protein